MGDSTVDIAVPNKAQRGEATIHPTASPQSSFYPSHLRIEINPV